MIAGLTVAIFVAGVVQHVIDVGAPSLLDSLGLVGIVTFLLFPVMGLLLVRRQPSNAVGWLPGACPFRLPLLRRRRADDGERDRWSVGCGGLEDRVRQEHAGQSEEHEDDDGKACLDDGPIHTSLPPGLIA
jgi:hypothetical protein